MSQEEIELVRRGYEAFNQRAWEAASNYLHPDIEWHDPSQLPGSAVHRGIDEVLAFWRELTDALDGFTIEIDRLFEADDRVVALVRSVGVGRVSGLSYERAIAQVWTVRDGRAVRVVGYDSREQALEAAGLSE